MTSISWIWLLKTIFRFYMDVVNNNDFLDVFMYLIVGNNIWIFTSMDVVNNNDFLDVFHVFGCLKQDLPFT